MTLKVTMKKGCNVAKILPRCYRRELLDLSLFFSALWQTSDLDIQNVNFLGNNPRTVRRNEHCNIEFTGVRPRLEFRFNTYYKRLVYIWNSLPIELKEIDNTEC